MPAEECLLSSHLRQPAGGFLLAVIFANGEFNEPPNLKALLARAGFIVAADGGAEHCARLGVQPHLLIGDFDSISTEVRMALEIKGAQVLAFPTNKDKTDLELAVEHSIRAGANEVVILGGLGRRWDHSLANLLLAAQPQFADIRLSFIQGEQRLHILRGENEIEAQLDERVSLIPLGGAALGITTTGLAYPLRDEMLNLGSTRGVSNVVVANGPRVKIRLGVLLCVISSPDLN
jgi:thiamine pyrophosphokinase